MASAFAIMWGSAWLAGGYGVELAGWGLLITVALYTTLRRIVRFFIGGASPNAKRRNRSVMRDGIVSS